METLKNRGFGLLAIAAIFVFAACDDGSGKTSVPSVTGISARYMQGGTVYPTTPLESLKAGLTVTAHYSDSTSQAVNDYALSGILTIGASKITATYAGMAAIFTVDVSDPDNPDQTIAGISASYAQGGTSVYPTTPLDDLKAGLTVTAYYSDGTSQTVAAYTLSGTLAVGTSEITAMYQGHAATFSVSVQSPTPVTVDFNINGGSGAMPNSITVNGGQRITLPDGSGFSRSNFTFSGWHDYSYSTGADYAAGSSYTVNHNVTLLAMWTYTGPYTADDIEDFGPGASINDIFDVGNSSEWSEAMRTIGRGGSNKNYIVNVIADFYLTSTDSTGIGSSFSPESTSGVKVSLRGEGRTLTSERSLGMDMDNTVIWRDITLQGSSSYRSSLFTVYGTLIMHSGRISGNSYSATSSRIIFEFCGGVYVHSTGTFIMNGGEISDNTLYITSSSYNSGYYDLSIGGGVYVHSDGTFTMSSGEISDNTTYIADSYFENWAYGGAVCVYKDGTFAMSGGEISGNDSNGVYMAGGTFTMSGGGISGNTGKGVFVGSFVAGTGATFIMDNGEISGNICGVYMYYHGTFTMNNGKISGNIASDGGGVYLVTMSSGIFTMNGGEISGNTATYGGGGVYVGRNGTFAMNNGKISGNTASDGGGVLVYINGTFAMNRGEISDNTATSYGSGVYVGFYEDFSPAYTGTFIMNGGKISGKAEPYSGVVYMGKGTFTVNGGEILCDDTAYRFGVYMGSYNILRIFEGTIEGLFHDTYDTYDSYSNSAQYGIFIDNNWYSYGDLDSTDETIRVIGGVLQQ
jgi:hypothetical protein